jgi:hypothetical protein
MACRSRRPSFCGVGLLLCVLMLGEVCRVESGFSLSSRLSAPRQHVTAPKGIASKAVLAVAEKCYGLQSVFWCSN